ncbi:hypothetical protein NQ315_014338 [Exocentrus adspersus]|uniref:Aldose 1-epimerase n=1 Tax=Exocentrus adspersus TaxID=1586481 RepID=A0AAV8VLI9_9CUCU|nr:hypothetical protein NQ315_014338 [Exocentrus adspersus]
MGISDGSKKVLLSEDTFGKIKDKPVTRFTWTNTNNVSVQLITYGGYITSIKVPDKDGNIEDVVIGFKDIEGYLSPQNRYFGATVGRVANRIAGASMTIEGTTYKVTANNGVNQLHGGLKGFDKVIWNHYVKGKQVVLSYHSSDLEEGHPGDLVVNVTFELTADNEILIDYQATTTKPTCVNLTNHSYFNLAGNGKGAAGLYDHVVAINADRITETNAGIPTGKILPVSGTVFDFRIPKRLGDVINNVPNAAGYDNNFCIIRGTEQETTFVAKIDHPKSGRTLEVYSNQPGVQFYTGNALPEDKSVTGKDGYIQKHAAFCLETQIYPDAIHHKNFPQVVLYPGERYHHTCTYKFVINV